MKRSFMDHANPNGELREQKQRGQATLEFALTLPITLLFILGIIEFGRMMITYTAISSASREAARYGAAAGNNGEGTIAKYEDCDGIHEAAKRITEAFLLIEDTEITVQYDRGPGTAFYSKCAPDPAEVHLGDRIVVNVSATYEPIIDFGFGNFNIVSETRRTIVKEVVLK